MKSSEGAEDNELQPFNPPDLETGREERGEEEGRAGEDEKRREQEREAAIIVPESGEEEGGGGAGDGVRCYNFTEEMFTIHNLVQGQDTEETSCGDNIRCHPESFDFW